MYKQNEDTQQNRKNVNPNKGKTLEANKRQRNKEDKQNTVDNGRKPNQTNKTH